jgi:hypothetical protein
MSKKDTNFSRVGQGCRSLTRSEWIFGFGIAIILVSFLIISKRTGFESLRYLHYAPRAAKPITVNIQGAVHKPGACVVPSDSTLRFVLRKARLRPDADLSNLDLDSILADCSEVVIPALNQISIAVSGCVEQEGAVTLAAGSRICDLKGKVTLTTDADSAFLHRRKILKNHETVQIPARKKKDS